MVSEIVGNRVALNVYSDLNRFMDAMFVVSDIDSEEAKIILDKAFDDWFKIEEAEDYGWGEWLEMNLYEKGIEYEVYYSEEKHDEIRSNDF